MVPERSPKEAPAPQQDQRIKEEADVLRPINPGHLGFAQSTFPKHLSSAMLRKR